MLKGSKSGIGPISWFFDKLSDCRLVNRLRDSGILPNKEFCPRSILPRPRNDVSSLTISPSSCPHGRAILVISQLAVMSVGHLQPIPAKFLRPVLARSKRAEEMLELAEVFERRSYTHSPTRTHIPGVSSKHGSVKYSPLPFLAKLHGLPTRLAPSRARIQVFIEMKFHEGPFALLNNFSKTAIDCLLVFAEAITWKFTTMISTVNEATNVMMEVYACKKQRQSKG